MNYVHYQLLYLLYLLCRFNEMAKLPICLLVFGAIFSYSVSKRENFTCGYNDLEDALKEDQNKFLLQTTFFPPNVDSPVYVTVTYNFSTSSVDYVWSTATLYFILHPNIIGYLSLFFSYIERYRVVQLELNLPEECSSLASNTNSDATNFLFTLTHRVKESHLVCAMTFTLHMLCSYSCGITPRIQVI